MDVETFEVQNKFFRDSPKKKPSKNTRYYPLLIMLNTKIN